VLKPAPVLSRDDPVIARGNARSQGGLGVNLDVDARPNAHFNHLRRRRGRLIFIQSRVDTRDNSEQSYLATS